MAKRLTRDLLAEGQGKSSGSTCCVPIPPRRPGCIQSLLGPQKVELDGVEDKVGLSNENLERCWCQKLSNRVLEEGLLEQEPSMRPRSFTPVHASVCYFCSVVLYFRMLANYLYTLYERARHGR